MVSQQTREDDGTRFASYRPAVVWAVPVVILAVDVIVVPLLALAQWSGMSLVIAQHAIYPLLRRVNLTSNTTQVKTGLYCSVTLELTTGQNRRVNEGGCRLQRVSNVSPTWKNEIKHRLKNYCEKGCLVKRNEKVIHSRDSHTKKQKVKHHKTKKRWRKPLLI